MAGDGSKFVAALDGTNKLPAGMYKLKVSAVSVVTTGEGEDAKTTTSDPVSEVLQLKVTVPVAIASAELNGLALAAGETIEAQEFSSGSGDALRVDVKLERTHDKAAVTAHQAFLRFSHASGKSADTYFVLTADKHKTHSAVLQFAILSKKFGYQSGDYKLQLIIGDPTFEVRVCCAKCSFSVDVLLKNNLVICISRRSCGTSAMSRSSSRLRRHRRRRRSTRSTCSTRATRRSRRSQRSST